MRSETTSSHSESIKKTTRLSSIPRKCILIVVNACSLHCRVAELYEYAMLPDHMWSPDESVGPNSITETGALCISSGSKTGRVPKQKRIVEDDITRDVSEKTKSQ